MIQKNTINIVKYLKTFEAKKIKTKYFTLDWMSGERIYFNSEQEMLNEFNKLKNEAIKDNTELDMECLILIDSFNNID